MTEEEATTSLARYNERRRQGFSDDAPMTPEQQKWVARSVGFGAPAGLLILWGILTLTNMVSSVDKGHVGLVHTFGKITETRANGLSVVLPWQTMETVDVRSRTICAKGDHPENGECKSLFEPFSAENIDVHLRGAFTYHVDPKDIAWLYTKIGPSFEDRIILPMLSDVVRYQTNKFGYQAIAANRPAIDKGIFEDMELRLRTHPQEGVSAIKADSFTMMNFDFNQDVKDAINTKVLESEKANRATAELQTQTQQAAANKAKAEGEANVARAAAEGQASKLRIEAEGRAAATLTEARAQAEANDLLNRSLTANLLQLESIKRLNPGVQSIIVPSGSGNFFDFGQVLQQRLQPAAPAPAPAPAR